MSFCLPAEKSKEFIQALRDGAIDPARLAAMTSEERHGFFESIVGKENASEVNAAFESKLLLKDYKKGLVTWAKNVAGLKEPVRRDLIARIEKLDRVLNPDDEKAFLADLAAQKIGASVTVEEAKNIVEFSKTIKDLEGKIPSDSPIRSKERLEYGLALDNYHEYLNHLLGKSTKMTFKEFLTNPSKWFSTVAGATKGIVSSLDNSFFGRQGFKMLFTNPDLWTKVFLKSWADIAKETFGIDKKLGFAKSLSKGIDTMKVIRADILSRPNALNGKYKTMKLAVGVDFEEAFPSTLPERIPILGRLYNASEAAFNGAALRMRADYADRIIKLVEKNGLDMKNPDQAVGIGQLVNSFTGRGDIGKLSAIGGEINSAIFSIRFLKSNIDTLTMHRLGFGIEGDLATKNMVRRIAATNLLRIVGGVAAILATSNALVPGSADLNPTATNFGKLKYGKTTIDVSGGMGSIVTLAARIIAGTEKTSSGKVTKLNTGKFGMPTTMDVINNYWEGKLSPLAGVFRDILKGQNFNGQPVTVQNALAGLVTPLPAQTFQQLMNEPDAVVRLAAMIADGLGFSANPPQPK